MNRDFLIENGVLKRYRGNDGRVVIPGDVKIISSWAFRKCIHITDVTIPDSVTEICDGAFQESLRLECVTISGSVSKIGGSAFAWCRNLKSVTISPGVMVIGNSAFEHCSNLHHVTLPEGLKEIGDLAFSDCTGLWHINFPDSLTKIGAFAFSGCRNLKLANKPDCTPVIGENAFKNVPPSVEAALKAAARKKYELHGAWIVTITKLRRHENADRLLCTDVFGYHVITDLNCTTGQRMVFFPAGSQLEREFAEEICSLTGGFLHGERPKIRPLKIRGEVSEGLLLPIEVLSRYTDIAELRDGDGISELNGRAVCSMTIPERMEIDPINNTLLKFHEGGDCPKTVIIPYGIRKIGRSAFMRCKKPVKIIIPETVENIGDYAFFECTSLCEVLIPGSVDSIGRNAFAGCSALTSVKILDGVKCIDDCAFQNCARLNFVGVPDSVTGVGFKVFDGCGMLKSVRIKNYKSKPGYLPDYSTLEKLENGSGSEYMNAGGVVFSRDMSELIRYPASKDGAVYVISKGVKKIRQYAFSGNEHLTEVIIPDGVTAIEHRAFENCRNLQSITIPPSVTYMGDFVFIGIHTSPNSKQQRIGGDVLKASIKSIIGVFESYGTAEGILIRGKKGSEAERYARQNGCAFEEAKELGQVTDEQYTYEDYEKDFELDYLGFDGIPDEPVPGLSPEKTAENEPESKDGSLSDDFRSLRRADGSSEEKSSTASM